MTDAYSGRLARGSLGRRAFAAFAAAMRRSDRRAASRVTRYVAESRYVAEQIRSAYGREADVIYPPVDCELFTPSPDGGHDDYYLFAGRLIEPYKRPGIVIEAFRELGLPLVVAGDGPAYGELRSRAPANVNFVGHVSDDELVSLMQRCVATVFPSVDDFGLIPVEAMACGRPVIAFAGGGALETVVAGRTGEFFGEQSTTALLSALRRFDPARYDSAAIRSHAEAWRIERFQREITAAVLAAAEARPPAAQPARS